MLFFLFIFICQLYWLVYLQYWHYLGIDMRYLIIILPLFIFAFTCDFYHDDMPLFSQTVDKAYCIDFINSNDLNGSVIVTYDDINISCCYIRIK